MLFLQLYYSFLIPNSVGPIGIVNGEDEYLFLDGWYDTFSVMVLSIHIVLGILFPSTNPCCFSGLILDSHHIFFGVSLWRGCCAVHFLSLVFFFLFFSLFFFFGGGGRGSMNRDFAVDNTVAHFFLYLVFFFSSFFFFCTINSFYNKSAPKLQTFSNWMLPRLTEKNKQTKIHCLECCLSK